MTTTRTTSKDQAMAIIQDQPDDATFDDLLRELIMYRAVLKGLADVEAGRTISNEQLKKEVDSWFQ